jgi:hypothetical protein
MFVNQAIYLMKIQRNEEYVVLEIGALWERKFITRPTYYVG